MCSAHLVHNILNLLHTCYDCNAQSEYFPKIVFTVNVFQKVLKRQKHFVYAYKAVNINYICIFQLNDFQYTSSGVRVTRSSVLCICLVDRYLSFCPFSFGHCVVCS